MLTKTSPPREGGDARRLMHPTAAVIVDTAGRFRFVHTDANTKRHRVATAFGHRVLDGDRTIERRFGGREGDEEAVTAPSLLDLLTVEACEEPAQCRVMPAQDVGPSIVAHGRQHRRRTLDVGEHERPDDAGLRSRLPQQLEDAHDVGRCPQLFERADRLVELEVGCVGLAEGAKHDREGDARSRLVIRGADLLPGPDRLSKLALCNLEVTRCRGHYAARLRGAARAA